MKIQLSWKDSRLDYYDLNEDYKKNMFTFEEKSLIWIPSLIFPNTLKREVARFDGKRSIGTISMLDGNYCNKT